MREVEEERKKKGMEEEGMGESLERERNGWDQGSGREQ